MKKENIKWFVILHCIILLLSLSGICAKTAAKYPFLSLNWIFYYGLVILILGIYAIAWQQVIKRLPLIVSYANKGITTIWGLVWGFLLFQEKITLTKFIGAIIIIIGIYFVVTGEDDIS